MRLKISESGPEGLYGVSELAEASVVLGAQKASHAAAGMAVIDCKALSTRGLAADRTEPTLGIVEGIVILYGHVVSSK